MDATFVAKLSQPRIKYLCIEHLNTEDGYLMFVTLVEEGFVCLKM